jgi:hypothetical protein
MGVLSSYADMDDDAYKLGEGDMPSFVGEDMAQDSSGSVWSGYMPQQMDYLEEQGLETQQSARRLRQAQIAALRMAEAQIAEKKRFDAQVAAQDPEASSLFNADGDLYGISSAWPAQDQRLDHREPPSPAAASTASRASAGLSRESRGELEESQCSEAEWSQSAQSQQSSSGRPITSSELTKARIYQAMAQLKQARENARRTRELEARQALERTQSTPPSSEPPTPPRKQQSEVAPQVPREGAAWEAARREAAQALAQASTGQKSAGSRQNQRPAHVPSADASRSASTAGLMGLGSLSPPQSHTLGLKRYEAREQEKFAAAVQLQLKAQQAMKKRVEMSETSRQDNLEDS